jgi:hypothetical protein
MSANRGRRGTHNRLRQLQRPLPDISFAVEFRRQLEIARERISAPPGVAFACMDVGLAITAVAGIRRLSPVRRPTIQTRGRAEGASEMKSL